MDRPSYVYILASAPYGTLCTGVTTDLVLRVWQPREKLVDGFTKTYRVNMLVWYEIHADVMTAIAREKQLKKYKRAWKVSMVSKSNPRWRDLFLDFTG